MDKNLIHKGVKIHLVPSSKGNNCVLAYIATKLESKFYLLTWNVQSLPGNLIWRPCCMDQLSDSEVNMARLRNEIFSSRPNFEVKKWCIIGLLALS